MGRRNVLEKYSLFSNKDTATNPISVFTDVSSLDLITYEIDIESTVNATLEVQYCNDQKISGSSVFKPLDFVQSTLMNGANDTDGLVHINNKGFKFLRLAVINNGGSGNINAAITGSVIGA
jgi:exosome complex RNA-binding protein Rrp4